MVIEVFKQFIEHLNGKKVFVILDNASTHTSNLFMEEAEKWKEKGLELIYLTPYSPHLNKIEILWKHIKYFWLKPKDYLSFECFENGLDKILSSVTTKYKINS